MVSRNLRVIDRYFGSVADKNLIFLKKQCQHFKNNMYRNTIFAFRFITVFLMSSFLFAQVFMTPIQFEMEKREREEKYGEDLNEAFSLDFCNFDNPEELKRKKNELEKNVQADLNRQLLVFVKTFYEDFTKGDNTKSESRFIEYIKTETIRMPMPGLDYDHIRDGNILKVNGWVIISAVKAKVNQINRDFYNESIKLKRKFRQKLSGGDITNAIDNLAEIYAYKSSVIPYADYIKYRIDVNVFSELTNILSNLKLVPSDKKLDGIRYLYPVDREVKITATHDKKPVSGLYLLARMKDGHSNWPRNIKEMRPTNAKGSTEFKLTRILSRASRQTISVDLDYKKLKNGFETVAVGKIYLLPNWYDDFEKLLRRGSIELEIPIQVEFQLDLYISSKNYTSNELPNNIYKDFKRIFESKDINVTANPTKNTLTLLLDTEKGAKEDKMITSLVNRNREIQAIYESKLPVSSSQFVWDSQIKKHVNELLDDLDRSSLKIISGNDIKYILDRKISGTINNGREDIRLSYGLHEFSFSKPGYWDMDTTISVHQPNQEFPIKLEKIDVNMALGLPYPSRDFTLNIKSDNSRKYYQLEYEKDQFYYNADPNIRVDKNNIIHFNRAIIGNYNFKLSSKGRKSYEKDFVLDGRSHSFHQINFEPLAWKDIRNPFNILIPGISQRKIGYNTEGLLVLFSSVFTAGLSVVYYNESMKYLEQYRDAKDSYEILKDVDQNILDEYRLDTESKYNSYSRNREKSMMYGGGFILLGTGSFLHAVWTIKDRR